MFDALINQRIDTRGFIFDVAFHDIEELNRGVLKAHSEPLISKISYSVLPSIIDRFVLLDSGSALGRGNGQLLVRRVGESGPIRRVAIPGELTTANAMLGRFFPEIQDRTPMHFSEIARAVERGDYDAGVLIHEGRFTYCEHHLQLVADLGALWEQQTALPLPLGAIVAHRYLTQSVIEEFDSLLHDSIAYAFAHPEASRAFVKAHARELDDHVINQHIALFVNAYSLSLGDEGRKAVQKLTGIVL
jgi:1,4-dihydroxy-6-naphthoate synthase